MAVRVRVRVKAPEGRYVGFRERAAAAHVAMASYGRARSQDRTTPNLATPRSRCLALTPQRSRQSHRLNAGHRRTASTRAGPDEPAESPAPLWRHPRFGLVNNALAAFLGARS